MANIVAVRIQGFQSHADSLINLGPGLNVITGPSDSGKTAVIRAVRWVAFNEPQGEAFVNEKVGEALVALHMDNGLQISKRRKKGKTSYLLQTGPNDEGSLFEKSEVPEEVKAALGITKQTFGDFTTALNFAFQLEAPFLISETASAGAKILGKLAGTEAVDVAVKAVSKDTYAARQERQQGEKDVAKINTQLLEYFELEQIRNQLEAVEYLASEVETDVKRLENLRQQKTNIETISESLVALTHRLDGLTHVPELEIDLKNIEKAQERYDTLLDLYSKGAALDQKLSALTTEIKKYENLQNCSLLLEGLTHDENRVTALTSFVIGYQKQKNEVNNALRVLEKTKDLEVVDLEGIGTMLQQKERLQELYQKHNTLQEGVEGHQKALEQFRGLEEAEALINATANEIDVTQFLKKLKVEMTVALDNLKSSDDLVYLREAQRESADHELTEAWKAAGGICPLCEQTHKGGGC